MFLSKIKKNINTFQLKKICLIWSYDISCNVRLLSLILISLCCLPQEVFAPSWLATDCPECARTSFVTFILCHRGAQQILAYSWARPAILVAGKGRGGCFYFFCFFTFIPIPLSSLSLSFISSTISSIFCLPFSGRRHKMTHKG